MDGWMDFDVSTLVDSTKTYIETKYTLKTTCSMRLYSFTENGFGADQQSFLLAVTK